MSVKFENNSAKVKAEINQTTIRWLYEACGELEAQVKRNTRVDTGQTKGSWTYKVDETNGEGMIGSQLENAIWEEFGTGQYALNGDGRKTAWRYQDNGGTWHETVGKRPNRALNTAFNSSKTKLRKLLETMLKGMG